jgi:hypothetical protein
MEGEDTALVGTLLVVQVIGQGHEEGVSNVGNKTKNSFGQIKEKITNAKFHLCNHFKA